jgi:hypothetical protein
LLRHIDVFAPVQFARRLANSMIEIDPDDVVIARNKFGIFHYFPPTNGSRNL